MQNNVTLTNKQKHKRGFSFKNINKSNFLEQIEMQSMVWPGLIFLFIFSYIPMYGLIIAFKDYNLITGLEGAPWVGFKYFKEFFTDPNLWNITRNTFAINLLGLVVCFPAPIILAVLISELKRPKFKKVAQTVSYLPHFLSWVIFGGIILEILTPSGVLNGLLTSLGIVKEPINFIAKGEYFYLIITIASLIKGVGFGSILYVAAIAGVDQEMYEASVIDGCNRFQKIWYITLPAIMGTIVIMLIFQISSILNTGFEHILLLQNGLNIPFSETIDSYVYKVGMQQSRFSYATAIGVFKSVVSVVLLVLANYTSKKITDKGLF